MPSYDAIAERARALLPQLRDRIAGAGYEPAGVPNSEILFLLACLQGAPFTRLIESGRARGQSTLTLSLALPDKEIVSIERDKDSPNVAVANERLRDRKNVTLLFGDARRLLPGMVRPGDVVLIDGPKEFRAVRLAIMLLATGKVSSVFVHDLTIETPERAFVSRHFPEARFSDWRGFKDVATEADANIAEAIPPSRRYDAFAGEFGYGYALTWFPLVPGRPYRLLLWRAVIVERLIRLGSMLGRKQR